MNRVKRLLKDSSGSVEMISSIVVALCLFALLAFSITILGQVSRIDDLNQMAQRMAREISLSGRAGADADRLLAELESTYGMQVTMRVDGDFLAGSGRKLRTESDFTVTLSYQSEYGLGGFIGIRENKTYTATAAGKVEEYHK